MIHHTVNEQSILFQANDMGNKLKNIGYYFLSHKFIWSTVIFLLIIGIFDSNSIWNRIEKRQENERLRAEIRKYELQCSRDSSKLQQLLSSPDAVIRVARETHLMKADDEDVYIVTVAPKEEEE